MSTRKLQLEAHANTEHEPLTMRPRGWGEGEIKFHDGAQTAGKIPLTFVKSLLDSNNYPGFHGHCEAL